MSGALLYHLPGATGMFEKYMYVLITASDLTKLLNCLSIDAPISSLCYSPQPDGGSRPHLATGLTTGEVKMFEPLSGPIFTLQHPVVSSVRCAILIMMIIIPYLIMQEKSAVSSIAYSSDGKIFAVGHENGELHFWRGNKLPLTLQSILIKCYVITNSNHLHNSILHKFSFQ